MSSKVHVNADIRVLHWLLKQFLTLKKYSPEVSIFSWIYEDWFGFEVLIVSRLISELCSSCFGMDKHSVCIVNQMET